MSTLDSKSSTTTPDATSRSYGPALGGAVTAFCLVLSAGTSPAAATALGTAEPAPLRMPVALPNSSRRGSLQSWLANKDAEYRGVYEAIGKLGSVTENGISESAKDDGLHILSLLYALDFETPKITAPDEDCVAFAWDRHQSTTFLSVCEGFASLLETSPGSSNIVASSSLVSNEMVGLLQKAGKYVGAGRTATSTS